MFAHRSRRWFLRRLGLAVAGTLVRAALRPARATAQPSSVDRALPPFVRPRDAWGAAPPGAGMRPHRIERVTVHHTGPPTWEGTPEAAAYLCQIQAFHTGPERGWPDIAYHLLVDLDGLVWEGRSLAFTGDTVTAYDPAGHALVAVLGDYDVQTPNGAQLDALATTVRWLLEAYGLKAGAIGGHRDYAATACPGRNLYPVLSRLVS